MKIVNKLVGGTRTFAGEPLQQANDAQHSFTDLTYVKKKETALDTVPKGTIRVKFDIWGGAAAQTTFGRIYRNGAAIGTERSTLSETPVTFSEDFDTSGWADGDLLQLYVKGDTATYNYYCRRLRIYFTFLSWAATNQDP